METISARGMRDKILAFLKREPLRLTDQRPKRTMKRVEIRVPAGHELPLGEKVRDPFRLIVEAGVRWDEEWPEPRVTVNGWRVFPLGDALCWAGDELAEDFGTLLPTEIVKLAAYHGQAISLLGDYGREAMDEVGVIPPSTIQPLSSFIIPERRLH